MATTNAITPENIHLNNPFTQYSYQIIECIGAMREFFMDVLGADEPKDKDLEDVIKKMAVAAGNNPDDASFDQIGFCLNAAENAAFRIAAIIDFHQGCRAIALDPEISNVIEIMTGRYKDSQTQTPETLFRDVPWIIETVLSYLSQSNVYRADPQSPISVAMRMLACLMATFHANPTGLNLQPPEELETEGTKPS